MRVAICISGDMRTYKKTYKSLMDNLVKPYNADVFISTWTTTTVLKDGKRISEDVIKDDLLSMYNPKKLNLHEFSDEYFYELNGVKIPDKLIEVKPNAFRANIPQHYLMYDCINLKIEHEKNNNFKYDYVIRTRPDLLIFKKIKLTKLSKKIIYLKHIINNIWYCDQFAIASTKLMDEYCSIFPRLNDYWKNPIQDGQFKNIKSGETLMRYHILSNDLPHDRLKILFPIIRGDESRIDMLKKIYLKNMKNLVKLYLTKIKFNG